MTTTQLDDCEHALGRAAAEYIRHGWAVFPVEPRGKAPLTSHGFRDATTDENCVAAWWDKWPTANVGFTPSSARLLVVDVDGPEGEAEAEKLGLLSEPTLRVETARGFHLYFSAPPEDVAEGVRQLGTGLDIRGRRGYVVLPPSVHESGAVYRFVDAQAPALTLPPRALERLRKNGTKAVGARAAVVVDQVIPGGERNATLTSLAGSMRRRAMTAEEIEAALLAVNANRCRPPLEENEVRRIATSVAAYAPAEGAEKAGCEAGQRDLTHDGLTDSGNAARLIELHGTGLHYIARWDKWVVWLLEGGRWEVDYHDVHVRERAKDVGRTLKEAAARVPDPDEAKRLFAFGVRSLNRGGVAGMVDLARGISGILLDHNQLDADGWLLGVRNGVVDLGTGTLRPATPADLITKQCTAAYDPGALCERFERALREWFPDETVRDYVQRVAGAALVGEQRDHVFVIHYGTGGNGKGTFIRALTRALGSYAVVIHLSLIELTRYQVHDTEKAHLFRARLAVASETERQIRLREANVKNLTGGDRIHARHLYEDPWEFAPSHSLWLQTNYLPQIQGRDPGIWRRIRVVKWVSRFEGKTADPTLDDTLAAEAPGILRWLVAGCLAWQRDGLAEPEAVVRDTLLYRESQDVLARFAGDVGLVFDPQVSIAAGRLQELLEEWVSTEAVPKPANADVGAWLAENGARQTRQRVHDRRRKYWVGVGVPGLDGPETEPKEGDT